VQFNAHIWFLNLSSVSENVTSELAETHTLTVKQLCCLNVQSIAAEKLVGLEALGPVATTTVLLLLPGNPRYPKLDACPKCGDFTLSSNSKSFAKNDCDVE
jgi:hypothetical protein